jgi:hypothetical protein
MRMTTDFTENYDYDYPKDLNLRPDSTLHKKLLDALNDRIRRGYATSANSREMWRKEDHLQTAYVPPDAYSILDLDRDPKAPLGVVIPVSRANLDTMVSYAAGVFFGDPTGMYPLDARSDPVKMVRAAKMERLLDMQGQQFGHKLSHFIGLRDTFLYGISAKTPVWSKHKRREAVIDEVSPILYDLLKDTGVKVSPGDLIRYLEERVYHEGNEIENIDPYSLILDPHSTLKNYQKAEFMGYWRRTNSMNLLKDERDPENRIFNAKYVHKLAEQANGQSATQWMQQSGRFDRSGEVTGSDVPGHPDSATTHGTDIAHLYWNLIPKDWGLGDSEIPECWAFAVAADEVIIQAYNVDYDHGMIPMVLDGPQTCGYDLLPVSSIAATYGIHQFIDWKVRIHYWNASRVQNSMFVVDGSAVNVQDFKNGGPRQIIRLKRQLYGEETIDKFIRQLQVNDVTNDYPAHVQSMMQFNDYCLGTHAITQGDMSGMPDRPTQWGLQAAQQAALSRLSKECQMITEQSYYRLVQMQCHNNVQFLENEQVVKIIGSRYEEQLRQELGLPPEQNDMTVSPWDLDMDSFEIMTLNRMQKEADLMVMEKTLDRILAIPEIAMEAFAGIDVQRFFLAAVRKMGFPNVHEYKRAGGQMPGMNGQVMPDEQLEQQVQAGNLVPAGAVMQ